MDLQNASAVLEKVKVVRIFDAFTLLALVDELHVRTILPSVRSKGTSGLSLHNRFI